MARGDQLARQWIIMQTLISSKRGKSVGELAADLDCHPRTVYRDLEALQYAGFPIYTEQVEGKNHWSVLDTLKHHIPIPFSLPELMALYFSSDILKILKGTFFHDSLESLFQKIKTTLPPESLRYLSSVEKTLHVELRPYQEYDRFKETINCVNEAALEKKSIDMVYFTMGRRKETSRKVDPYRVLFFNGTFYLIGYCHLRKEVRIFALDRIKMLHKTPESFEVPEDFDLGKFMKPSFGVFRGEPRKVRIRFSAEVAGYIKEKIWHESQQIRERKDGSIVFEVEVAGTQEIKQWIMGWGSGAEVLEPKSLRDELGREAQELAQIYEPKKRTKDRTLKSA
ncbi:MAG: transcriptional regulator [bacterium]